MTYNIRDYQREALNQLRQGIAQGIKTQVLMMPTGSGKTVVASVIQKGAQTKGNKSFFVVDTLELIDQTVTRFFNDGLDVGVIQGDHEMTDYSKIIQVASIQTLGRRWGKLAESLKPKLLVIDECHVLHKAHIELIEWCKENNIPVIGLSATPFRKGLGKVFDRLVIGTTPKKLTEQGFLVPALCYAPNIPDLKGVKSKGGDWAEDALAEVMGEAKFMGDIVEHWINLAEKRKTIIFACTVAHSREIAKQFNQAGVIAAHIDGYMDQEERKQIIEQFRQGKIQVISNVAVLTKGFDVPDVSCVVLARPTKSLMLHIQMMGRGLRLAEGKKDCIIIDHAGNCLRNGLPTDELPSTLDDGKGNNPDRKTKQQDKKEREPRPCPKCNFLFSVSICPRCGFRPQAHEDVEFIDGKLVPLTEVTRNKRKFTPEEKQHIYAQMLGYAYKHNYSTGWAYHKTQEYCGSMPKNTHVPPIEPTQEIASWIKHKNIRWAKAQEKIKNTRAA
ncbi:MAG: helicase [Bacteriophage sp.]|nr:MAG: helicase [Bacteriophage sp.]